MYRTTKNLLGKKFGRLIVLEATHKRQGTNIIWKCSCDCGSIVNVVGGHLTGGITKSCGCLQKERAAEIIRGHRRAAEIIHGHCKNHSTSSTYQSWDGMHQRSSNPKNKRFKDYGGRGIKVCDHWLKFKNFLADMGVRPEGMTLDRKDNDGNYEPGNCRWATPKEQMSNLRPWNRSLAMKKGWQKRRKSEVAP